MMTATVSAKGQITLPRKIRQALELKAGERVVIQLEGSNVLLRPMVSGKARALAGSLRRYASVRKPANRVRSLVTEEVARAAAQEG